MWIDMVKAHTVDNRYVKPQIGADSAEIASAERRLNVRFPLELRSLLSEMNGDGFLLFSVEQIVQYNLDARLAFKETYTGLEHLLFVAGNGCGDYYAYSISGSIPGSNSGEVFGGAILSTDMVRWEHEDHSTVPVASSLAELIEKYYTDQI